jgi:2,5-diketo-D-gluconate reductase B
MHTVTANGAHIPALGYGSYLVTGADALRMIPAVLKLGYRHIDTAQIYENEREVGQAIRESGVRRGNIFLTTKVWPDRATAAQFLASVDESLAKLRTDYVDLLLLHWPKSRLPLAERMGLLNDVRRAGKARHIGVSNFSPSLMREAQALSTAPLATNQLEYHPYLSLDPTLSAARDLGISVTAYYAMARGRVLADAVLADIASRHGRTVTQVVLRWLVQQEGVIALSKTVSEARAAENAAIFDFALSEAEMQAIFALGSPQGRLLDLAGLAMGWD